MREEKNGEEEEEERKKNKNESGPLQVTSEKFRLQNLYLKNRKGEGG